MEKLNKKSQYVLSLSYGKDSMACLGAIEKLGLPLDRIITADVWATDTIPSELPPMVEFKEYADEEIKKRYGIDVEHFNAGISFDEQFYKIRHRKNKEDCIYGFPCMKGNWCNSNLKMSAIRKMEKEIKENCIQYVGIAYDEPNRFHNLSENKISPLLKVKWTEQDCKNWCIENNLLSPIYNNTTRGVCWFCYNQSIEQLRYLYKNYPEYWRMMLQWDLDSPVTFHSDGKTVHDYDKRFKAEELNLVPKDRKFRWKMLDNLDL